MDSCTLHVAPPKRNGKSLHPWPYPQHEGSVAASTSLSTVSIARGCPSDYVLAAKVASLG